MKDCGEGEKCNEYNRSRFTGKISVERPGRCFVVCCACPNLHLENEYRGKSQATKIVQGRLEVSCFEIDLETERNVLYEERAMKGAGKGLVLIPDRWSENWGLTRHD